MWGHDNVIAGIKLVWFIAFNLNANLMQLFDSFECIDVLCVAGIRNFCGAFRIFLCPNFINQKINRNSKKKVFFV